MLTRNADKAISWCGSETTEDLSVDLRFSVDLEIDLGLGWFLNLGIS